MTQQPEALRLADAIEKAIRPEASLPLGDWARAAAELRRLHGLDFALRNCELALKKMATKYMDAVDQRDALLEALRGFVSCALPVSTEIDERGHSWTEAYLDQALPIARAVIKTVEETK